ncbi:MAG TPA: hypothetical protein VND87_05230 [Stellaceae bacterium]|nr:hypothetical protein [Stellaceae bacterium]
MIQAGLAAIALLAALVVPASADWLNPRAALADATEDLRRAQSLYQSLRDKTEQHQSTTKRQADTGDVIHPPDADIDPKMMVVPPHPHGTMRVIPPFRSPGGDRNITPK